MWWAHRQRTPRRGQGTPASRSYTTDSRSPTGCPPRPGSNVTLALTLADGSTTEAIPCYYGGSVRLGTQYGAGNIVRLTYRENVTIYSTTIAKGWWADANYNTDTYDRIRVGTTLKAKTAIAAGRLAVTDADGCFPLAAGVPFDVTRPVLYCATAVSARDVQRQFLPDLPLLYAALH